MEKPDKKLKPNPQIKFELPHGPFTPVFYFNKFGFRMVEECFLLHFGLVTEAGDLLESHSCILDKLVIVNSKKSWLEYLGKIGQLPEREFDFDWQPPVSRVGHVPSSNICQIARTGDMAEIRFYTYSMGYLIDKGKGTTEKEQTITAQPLGLFRSKLDLHLAIIMRFSAPDETSD